MPLKVEQMLLLDLLDLQELLLEGQLLRRHLLLRTHTHTHQSTSLENTHGLSITYIWKPAREAEFLVCAELDSLCAAEGTEDFRTTGSFVEEEM